MPDVVESESVQRTRIIWSSVEKIALALFGLLQAVAVAWLAHESGQTKAKVETANAALADLKNNARILYAAPAPKGE